MEEPMCILSPCCPWERIIPKECMCPSMKFLLTTERNCSCFPCPYDEDSAYQFCHCTCSDYPNCHWCCCACANDPVWKCCCVCPRGSSGFRFYPWHLGQKREIYTKDQPRLLTSALNSRFFQMNSTDSCDYLLKLPKGNLVNHLVCPLCKKLRMHSYILPCQHCICQVCLKKVQEAAEITEIFTIIACPVCHSTHCLPKTDKVLLPEHYLRNRLAKRFMQENNIPTWRFDPASKPVFCQLCKNNRLAVKYCTTCNMNFCSECLRTQHMGVTMQDHFFMDVSSQEKIEKHCIYHPNNKLIEYCKTDNELLCGLCKSIYHEGHDSLPMVEASSQLSAALFSAMARFKTARHEIDNDLIEFSILKNSVKFQKDQKRKEIRSGFIRLRHILQEKEKACMEQMEKLEGNRQKEINKYVCTTTLKIKTMDGLLDFCKEALKETSQVAFLQSAKSLVDQIDNGLRNIYRPDPLLKADCTVALQLNFLELANALNSLFPNRQKEAGDSPPSPYPMHPEMMISRKVTFSTQNFTGRPICQRSCSSQSVHSNPPNQGKTFLEAYGRTQSIPTSKGPEGYSTYWATPHESTWGADPSKIQTYSSFHNWYITHEGNLKVPGLIAIYQTLVYPRAAKIYWTCPTEDVDSFEMEFYELSICSNNIRTELCGHIQDIMQQNLELHNLTPGTEYLFKVRAVNDNGPGEWSDMCKVVTPDGRGKPRAKWGLLKNIQSVLLKRS
ncbi:tripartite motif-containing protein 42 isoform X1 [Monodelphis domestica]|uniref:tripartite motif-containing protein 42 isoform X1 n=1 Tax=Monodelphis domestica TaxID=13616 RepID=UPI0024E20F05|nr:tripartite motif-containing protein 42 isoform X1 [Monodelphis domestica]